MSDVITGSTLIAALFPSEVISKEVAESLQAQSVIAKYVWIETEDASTSIKFGILPPLTAATFTDTVGMPLIAFQPTSNSVTAGPCGVAVRITGIGRTLRPQIVFEAANEQGKGIGAKVDTDLGALFASFGSSVGTTNTAMSTTIFQSAIGKLNKNKVPQDSRVAILGPTGYDDLLASAQSLNMFAFTAAAVSGQLARLYGVPVEQTPVLATANSGVDQVGGMFNRKALGLGMVKVPSSKIMDAPAQFDATDIASTVYYGVALIDGARGVEILSRV